MKSKTVKELRAAAKARGIKGYSKLPREALVRALEAGGAEAGAPAATPPTAPARKTARAAAKPATSGRARNPDKRTESQAAPSGPESAPIETGFASTEQLVEDAKYVLRPSGSPTAPATADLGEDIERLPELTQPVVALLAQKPGILHAYWVLPPGETARRDEYALRLCRGTDAALEVREEVPVRAERGSWYFHLPADSAEGAAMLVQLGYYENGRFVNAGGRSIARLPTLYASRHTDQRWWIDEAEFMRMYLRAGGFVTPAQRFGWNASIGSPAPGDVGPGEHLAWPGGISSSSR